VSGNSDAGQRGLAGIFDFSGSLAGRDDDGAFSEFQASFGFGNLLADAFVRYTDLIDPTLTGLLAELDHQLREDLPSSLDPLLKLDLANGMITFSFPKGATSYFVQSAVTDVSLASSVAL